MDQAWVFGPILCDLWHSVDVLASTSSILHLCVISLDRCSGITSDRDYLKIQNWLGAALWNGNTTCDVSELLSLKWTHGRLHHVIFLLTCILHVGVLKIILIYKGLKGRGLFFYGIFYDVNIFLIFFQKYARYWAITDPFNYPIKMSDKRAASLIVIVWVCSGSISFPAIAWWRLTAPGKWHLQRTEALALVCVGRACQRSMSNCQRLANFYEASVGWPPRIHRKGSLSDDMAVSFSLNIMLTDVK